MAWSQGPVEYELYGTFKYLNAGHVVLGALNIVVFACGVLVALRVSRDTEPDNPRVDALRYWFRVSLALTFFGYAVWFLVGLKNGVSPGLFLELLAADGAGHAESMREDYFPTIPGVTTCTQFGLSSVLLGVLLYFRGDRWVGKWLVALLLVSCVRSVLLSERMAMVELALPAIVLGLRLVVLPIRGASGWRVAGNALPIVAPLLLAIMFGGFEYFRSWQHYKNEFNSYPKFVVWRLSGYYTTAHNNGAMAMVTQPPRRLPYFTAEALWRFPGVGKSPLGYEKLTSVDMIESHERMLENYGAPELNSEGGLFQPLLDWGLPLSLVCWFGYGFLSGRAYHGFLGGHLGGLLFYPVLFLTLFDVPRLLLITDPRLTPTFAFLGLVLFCAVDRGSVQTRWSYGDEGRPAPGAIPLSHTLSPGHQPQASDAS